MNRIVLLLPVLLACFSCAVRAQQFDVPAGSVSLEPRGTSAGETGQVRWYELVANGRERVTLKAPDSLAADINLTWFSALPGGAAVAICVDSAGLLTTGCGGGAAAGVVNSIQLSNGLGGFVSATDFLFNAATPMLYLPGDIDTVTHRQFTVNVADSTFIKRRALWVDASDNMTVGLENAAGGNLKFRAGLGPASKYTLTMPDAAPADASGNNFLKFATSGVGSWDSIAAVDVMNNTVALTPRGTLNFLTTITATDSLVRTDIEVNMAANYSWTGVQSFDTNVAAFSTSRNVTGFGRVEAYTAFSGPSVYWNANPAAPTTPPYWRATISGNNLLFYRNGVLESTWDGSSFYWGGSLLPDTHGSHSVGSSGAAWNDATIESLTLGSNLSNGTFIIQNTAGQGFQLASGTGGMAWSRTTASGNYNFVFNDPTGGGVALMGFYTETASGSNERGVVAVTQEGSANLAELRPTYLSIGGSQIVTTRQTAVTAPVGGATIDSEARTAINAIISRLQTHGLIN